MENNPYSFFSEWFGKAKDLNLPQHEAMVLITATRDGKPSGRMVLLKGVISERGFWFFTNYESPKARDILENPQGQLLFYWPTLGRQIRIEGEIKKLSPADSDSYWLSRPRDSRIGGIASKQSQPLVSMDQLKSDVKRVENEYAGKEVHRPENWGGFELQADRFEFWADGEFRVHERITFEKKDGEWVMGRLYP